MSTLDSDVDARAFGELFVKRIPLIDVRAPVEFAAGHLPGAVNLPLLNDEERAAVGTIYKNSGQAAAIALGHKLVSGEIREKRISEWRTRLAKFPDSVLYCFRGGLRSQISRDWLRERGVEQPLIPGGYKAARNFLIERLARLGAMNRYFVISGPTGSGKTDLLKEAGRLRAAIDLEALANHRGSAFGRFDSPQPSQVDFENRLAVTMLEIAAGPRGPILIEDESRMIGKCSVPAELYFSSREEPVIMIEEKLEIRVENIFQEYVVRAPDHMKALANFSVSVNAISKKLGGINTKEVLGMIAAAKESFEMNGELTHNHAWIEKLLVCYYDPLYKINLQNREPKFAFTGSRAQCLDFLRT